jgi:hypothetical protein
LSDGRLFVAGGTKYGAVYPTTTELPDGDVLIFSGWRHEFTPDSDEYDADFIEAVERFDPETN